MLSNKTKYGLKAMIYLAAHEGEGGQLVADIAESQKIPKKFLDTILLELKNNGLLFSKKGKGGGYTLARRADEIVIGHIVRILGGPLAHTPCTSEVSAQTCPDCPDTLSCQIRWIMLQVRDATAKILDNTSLTDMIAGRAPVFILNYDI